VEIREECLNEIKGKTPKNDIRLVVEEWKQQQKNYVGGHE
jgi:hypothetical protein